MGWQNKVLLTRATCIDALMFPRTALVAGSIKSDECAYQ